MYRNGEDDGQINQMKKDELFEGFLFDQVSRSTSNAGQKNYLLSSRMRPVQSKVNYGMPNLTM